MVEEVLKTCSDRKKAFWYLAGFWLWESSLFADITAALSCLTWSPMLFWSQHKRCSGFPWTSTLCDQHHVGLWVFEGLEVLYGLFWDIYIDLCQHVCLLCLVVVEQLCIGQLLAEDGKPDLCLMNSSDDVHEVLVWSSHVAELPSLAVYLHTGVFFMCTCVMTIGRILTMACQCVRRGAVLAFWFCCKFTFSQGFCCLLLQGS